MDVLNFSKDEIIDLLEPVFGSQLVSLQASNKLQFKFTSYYLPEGSSQEAASTNIYPEGDATSNESTIYVGKLSAALFVGTNATKHDLALQVYLPFGGATWADSFNYSSGIEGTYNGINLFPVEDDCAIFQRLNLTKASVNTNYSYVKFVGWKISWKG